MKCCANFYGTTIYYAWNDPGSKFEVWDLEISRFGFRNSSFQLAYANFSAPNKLSSDIYYLDVLVILISESAFIIHNSRVSYRMECLKKLHTAPFCFNNKI